MSDVQKEIDNDLLVSGTSLVRINADGSRERINPSDGYIIHKPSQNDNAAGRKYLRDAIKRTIDNL